MHDLLFLNAAAIHKIPHQGERASRSFAELVAYFDAPLVREKKDADGGVALGSFREGVRRLTHFETTSLVGLDYDDGQMEPAQVFAALGRTERLVYPTFSLHPSGVQKSRAILTLSRAVDLPTHKRIMWVIYSRAKGHGITLDPACKDATRWWFSPVVHPDRVARHTVYVSDDGAKPLNVDVLLAYADKLDAAEAERKAERLRTNPPAPIDIRGKPAYVNAALRKGADNVQRASAGGRHEALNSEAYSLARLDLTEGEIASALVPAFVAVAGQEREREARRTIADACKARGVK